MKAKNNTFKIAPSMPQQLRAMAVGQTLVLPVSGTNYPNYMVARRRLQSANVGRWTQEWTLDRKALFVTRHA